MSGGDGQPGGKNFKGCKETPVHRPTDKQVTSLQIALAVVTTLLVTATACLLKKKLKQCWGE